MSAHGGARKGAGRPALKTKPVCVSMDPITLHALAETGLPRSEAIRVAVRIAMQTNEWPKAASRTQP